MKVVCCKNCGAKYQLDDNDDITTFECSSCAGDLEYVENYSDDEDDDNSLFDTIPNYTNSYIVQCEDCGLKYKIKSSENILDYECDSCGGSLRYLDDEMNEELDKYREEREKEIELIKRESKSRRETFEEEPEEKHERSFKSLTNKLGDFFSEENMQQIADDEKREQELLEEGGTGPKTARTTIPNTVLNKFGREFAVPNTHDYAILKSFLKNEFFKSMEVYYYEDIDDLKASESIFDKISISEPDNGEIIPEKNSINDPDMGLVSDEININNIILLLGIAIFFISIIEILLINSGIGIFTTIIGVIMLVFGLYKSRDNTTVEERKRIIREHLLTLSDEYYVFYNVNTPTSSASINHLVVGPTGIYAILSQKYNSNNALDSEKGNVSTLGSSEFDDDRLEEITIGNNRRRFRYTTKQAKFSKDNKIKQKALLLGEDLINFLNENNIKNCFVEPLVGFINNEVVVINMPLTDEDLFIDELLNQIKNSTVKLNQETIDKCAVLLSKYSADCSAEF